MLRVESLAPPLPEVMCRPLRWFVVFHHDSPLRLARALTWRQRFRHVSAFGYVESVDGWLFYSWTYAQSQVLVVPDEAADDLIGALSFRSTIVSVIPPFAHFERRLQLGAWCVPQVAHLTGVKSSALRPDAFFRDCLAHGGTIVSGDIHGQRAEAGSGSEAPAPGGPGGQAGIDTGPCVVADRCTGAPVRRP